MPHRTAVAAASHPRPVGRRSRRGWRSRRSFKRVLQATAVRPCGAAPCAWIPAPTPSTTADVARRPPPLENDLPSAAASASAAAPQDNCGGDSGAREGARARGKEARVGGRPTGL
ncbi:hypothetical protein B0H10DRAFT_539510 [Mycena sp. CBHHK59/15]|nr:hypothetical protein B0H10DRAFT_539510 [Mycena sp. CBHHK59/15]